MNTEIVSDDDDLEEDEYMEEDEYTPDTNQVTLQRIRVPRPLVWGLIILLCVGMIAVGVWGLAQSEVLYGVMKVSPGTSVQLAHIRAELAAAGAPEAALRHLDGAAQPGISIDDADGELTEADKALEPMSSNPAIAAARQEMRAILYDLNSKRFGYGRPTPSVSATPLPTLLIP